MRSFKWSLCALSLLVLNTSATSRFDSIVGKLTHALGQELEEIVNTAPVYKAEAVNVSSIVHFTLLLSTHPLHIVKRSH